MQQEFLKNKQAGCYIFLLKLRFLNHSLKLSKRLHDFQPQQARNNKGTDAKENSGQSIHAQKAR